VAAIAVDCGDALVDRVYPVPLRFNGETLIVLLDRAGARLCACLFAHRVLPAVIEAAQDAMAIAFESRLMELDRAAAGAAGTA
jgi:hypothetical protein